MNHIWNIVDGSAAIAFAGLAGWILNFMRKVDRRLTRIETAMKIRWKIDLG